MSTQGHQLLLSPGFELTLRPMRYPQFYEMYRDAIRNTWSVEEVDFSLDTNDLKNKFGPAERHLIERLIAFFATGDSIVSNNLVLNLYQHVNAPEARMYLSRQLYEEALHVQFYLTLLDTYLPNPNERAKAFAAVENIPSIRRKAEFCFKWIDSMQGLQRIETREQRRQFLLNMVCFAVFLRCVRLRLLPALTRFAAWPGVRHQLGFPRRERSHGVRVRGHPHRARGRA
jgi:ribonucleoside-diphosphate reductase beta chain